MYICDSFILWLMRNTVSTNPCKTDCSTMPHYLCNFDTGPHCVAPYSLIIISFTRTCAERLISRWALSVSQRQLHHTTLCFRADSLCSGHVWLWTCGCSFTTAYFLISTEMVSVLFGCGKKHFYCWWNRTRLAIGIHSLHAHFQTVTDFFLSIVPELPPNPKQHHHHPKSKMNSAALLLVAMVLLPALISAVPGFPSRRYSGYPSHGGHHDSYPSHGGHHDSYPSHGGHQDHHGSGYRPGYRPSQGGYPQQHFRQGSGHSGYPGSYKQPSYPYPKKPVGHYPRPFSGGRY